jgi:hypothetical protein
VLTIRNPIDRAVVWLIGNRVLLPGTTTLARTVAEVRREGNDRLHATLYEATPSKLRTRQTVGDDGIPLRGIARVSAPRATATWSNWLRCSGMSLTRSACTSAGC